jgi:hypothetical protein
MGQPKPNEPRRHVLSAPLKAAYRCVRNRHTEHQIGSIRPKPTSLETGGSPPIYSDRTQTGPTTKTIVN